jgi:hypothetical protein
MPLQVPDMHYRVLDHLRDEVEYFTGIRDGKYENNSEYSDTDIPKVLDGAKRQLNTYPSHVVKLYVKLKSGQNVKFGVNGVTLGTGVFKQAYWSLTQRLIIFVVTDNKNYDKMRHDVQAATD